jgi:hypothetical protein
MKLSNNKFDESRDLLENNELLSVDFDYGALDDSPLFAGEFGECLKDAVNNYLRRQIVTMFKVFKSMSVEEHTVLLGRAVYKKSFRELGRQIGRDKKTAQSRYADAIARIKNSPLVKVTFERKRRED